MPRRFRKIQASLLAGLGLLVCSSHTLNAQSSLAKRYGSREPHTCPSRKAPASGALSSAQAVQYFLCGFEKEGAADNLHLAANVKIEVSKGRRFNIVTDSFTGIDPSQLVYDIRGSFDSYSCTFIGNVNGERGKNCTHASQANATGECYKDSFGEWNCVMSDSSVPPTKWDYKVAPPAN